MLLRCAWGWDITEERRPLLNVFLKRGGAPTRPNRSQIAERNKALDLFGLATWPTGEKNEKKKKRPVNQTKYKKGRRRTRVK